MTKNIKIKVINTYPFMQLQVGEYLREYVNEQYEISENLWRIDDIYTTDKWGYAESEIRTMNLKEIAQYPHIFQIEYSN